MFLWEDYQYFFNSSWVFLLLTTLQNFLLHRLSPFLSVPFYVIALVYHSPFQKKTFIIILQNTDCALKNRYTISSKTAINKDKNTHKK